MRDYGHIIFLSFPFSAFSIPCLILTCQTIPCLIFSFYFLPFFLALFFYKIFSCQFHSLSLPFFSIFFPFLIVSFFFLPPVFFTYPCRTRSCPLSLPNFSLPCSAFSDPHGHRLLKWSCFRCSLKKKFMETNQDTLKAHVK